MLDAELVEVFPGKDTRVVQIVEFDAHGVIADRLQIHDPDMSAPGVQGVLRHGAYGVDLRFDDDGVHELHRMIRPQPGEAKWAAIPWETNLQAARERAAREDKPLFLWRAGGGDVLGRV